MNKYTNENQKDEIDKFIDEYIKSGKIQKDIDDISSRSLEYATNRSIDRTLKAVNQDGDDIFEKNITKIYTNKNNINKKSINNITEPINMIKTFIEEIKEAMSKCFTNTIQGDIINILREYIRDIEQYVDNRIRELKDKNTVNDAYKEYLNCYKDVNNINK